MTTDIHSRPAGPFCICGHSHIWHNGSKGRCNRSAAKYGKDCGCRRFKKAKDIHAIVAWNAKMLLAILALTTAGCTNLYPEKSEDREREHEFMEMHMKHIGK